MVRIISKYKKEDKNEKMINKTLIVDTSLPKLDDIKVGSQLLKAGLNDDSQAVLKRRRNTHILL
jgi:hypothetical protein